MARLPSRYAPFAFSVLQVTLTTGIATAIGVHQSLGFGIPFLWQWALAWAMAWLTMLPVVIFAAPILQRCVGAITAPPRGPQD
jgi:hypothetical protein